jgi:DeoR/GlpR family transcriptional regulator of sugar metabolism
MIDFEGGCSIMRDTRGPAMAAMTYNVNLSGVRRRKIAQLVQERGSVAVRDLCEQFGMSEATIRRDLRELGDKGVVTRTHGGVMINAGVMSDLPNEERKLVGSEEKGRIGLAAIQMLGGDEVVFLDAGTTALAVADNAHMKSGCRYVTTCLGVARSLRSQDIPSFFMVGGSYQSVNDSFAGTLAISTLRALSFDVSFLCCSAIDIARRSISIGDEIYSQVQREAIAVSRRNFVVAHSDKFTANAFIRTASFDDLDGIITDSGLDRELISRLQNGGLEVVLA